MDSDALLTFLTVHRRGGISNAAKALHRSQPAISRRIALLEQELGVPLFERVAGRTMLSDAGRVMVPMPSARSPPPRMPRMRSARWRGRTQGRLRSRWSARSPAGGCPRF
ncbi:helix-turn-helix domain-containing protein [Bradyrhizobium sp. RDT10]